MKTHMMLNEVFSGNPRRIVHGLDQFKIRLPIARVSDAQRDIDRLTEDNERPVFPLDADPADVQRLTEPRLRGINIPTD